MVGASVCYVAELYAATIVATSDAYNPLSIN